MAKLLPLLVYCERNICHNGQRTEGASPAVSPSMAIHHQHLTEFFRRMKGHRLIRLHSPRDVRHNHSYNTDRARDMWSPMPRNTTDTRRQHAQHTCMHVSYLPTLKVSTLAVLPLYMLTSFCHHQSLNETEAMENGCTNGNPDLSSAHAWIFACSQ